MKEHHENRYVPKSVTHIAVMILLTAFLSGCSSGDQAPLSDGLFLSYDFDGSVIRVKFSQINADKFYAILTVGVAEDGFSDPSTVGNQKIVDKYLKTKSGTDYEAGSLGPVWVPPSSVKKGGNAHGDTIQEIREWNGWKVGVVKASMGQGAMRGEWYYEKKTGFLVGGMRASITDDEESGSSFILDDSNIDGLF